MEGAIDAGGASIRRVVTAVQVLVLIAQRNARASRNLLTLFLSIVPTQSKDLINIIRTQCLFDNDCSFILSQH